MNALKERRVRRNRSFVGMVYGGVDLLVRLRGPINNGGQQWPLQSSRRFSGVGQFTLETSNLI